ncbi:rhodanese-like domain-containing protein [Paenibacillus sp. SI8]|uniref:rhodanese-like domain-containing protein n=1 Tax=unclassified Paenibacillus TaxID=185978 RepID=UPI003466F7ED
MTNKPFSEILPSDVLDRMKQMPNVAILDVREQDEWESGHIEGAKHIPLGQIARALNELDPKQETIIVCRSGNRSSTACDYLFSMGYSVVNMSGGMSHWTGEVKSGK